MVSKIVENTELQKKKRGRPKKSETLVAEPVDTSVIKRKRGRPRKVPFSFSEDIINVFNNYTVDNKELLNMFINSTESRVSQTIWNKINDNVKSYVNKLDGKDFFLSDFKKYDYAYKPNSSWKSIDSVKELSRKKCVNELLNDKVIEDEIYRSYLIFNHLKIYITETAKEIKIKEENKDKS